MSHVFQNPLYLQLREGENLEGNDRFEGLIPDMLAMLCYEGHLPCNYELRLVVDGKYGTRDPATGKWDGMVGEVQENVRLMQGRSK